MPDSRLHWSRTRGMCRPASSAFVAFAGHSLAAETPHKAAGSRHRSPRRLPLPRTSLRFFRKSASDCHHKGSLAPMSLVSYEETRPWAKAIKERVILRQMPPWHIDKTVGIQQFKNSAQSRWRSRQSACMASCRAACRAGRASSACGWPWAPGPLT